MVDKTADPTREGFSAVVLDGSINIISRMPLIAIAYTIVFTTN